MNVAIVGAGWAGLAAASECLARDWKVTLFDAAHTPGGRARSVNDPWFGELDNGQHLLIGAYEQTLALMRRDVGAETVERQFMRLPLWLRSADHRFELQAHPTHSGPWAQAWMLWRARGITLADKWHLTRFLQKLSAGRGLPADTGARTVAQWLEAQHQGSSSCRWLWHPLCLATMNTPADQACATLFAKVIKDSLLSKQERSTDLLIPRVTLGQLWPRALAQRVTVRWGHAVRDIRPADQAIAVDGQCFDACVVATAPKSAERLLAPHAALSSLCHDLSAFEYRAIATCYVAVKNHQPLPAPLLLFDHMAPGQTGMGHVPSLAQWVFDRSVILPGTPSAQLAFVISDAPDMSDISDHALAQDLVKTLDDALNRKQRTEITAARCFVEKRATFAAVPSLARPATHTAIERLVLAGDWTDTGYPAVLEGAIRSGIKAVDCLNQQVRQRTKVSP